jgi:iduronate 2-sulfatase
VQDVHGFPIKFNGTCNETRSRNFRRGYYAAVSYTDYNIGKLLDKLDELKLTESTAVVTFGDHGPCSGNTPLLPYSTSHQNILASHAGLQWL